MHYSVLAPDVEMDPCPPFETGEPEGLCVDISKQFLLA